jgi:NAD(P)H-quinone oxidoreductase subunit T, chloroplastic
MASTASSSFLSPLLHAHRKSRLQSIRREVRVFAASESSDEPTATTEKRKRRVDTRIHWTNMDEGWIGGKTKKETEGGNGGGKNENKEEFLGSKFADLLSQASESHYELSILISV